MGRVIAIGDIHGCYHQFIKLLNLINPRNDDTIITLGDHVGWGPMGFRVVAACIALQQTCKTISLRGDHEEMMINASGSLYEFNRWAINGGMAVIRDYGAYWPESLLTLVPLYHWQWLTSLPLHYETDTHIFVHAGYHPDLNLEYTPEYIKLWDRVDMLPERKHVSGKTVVVGHTPDKHVRYNDNIIIVDTGCCFPEYGTLTAVDLTNNIRYHVHADGATSARPLKSTV